MPYTDYLVSLPKAGDFKSKRPLLSDIYRLGQKRDILIKGSKYSGLSSLLLEICQDYLEEDYLTIFFDFQGTIRKDRIKGLESENLIVVRPTEADDLREILKLIKHEEKAVLLFDGSYYVSDVVYNFKESPVNLRNFINNTNPNCSCVITDNTKKIVGHSWSEIILISNPHPPRKNKEGVNTGHVIDVTGSLGTESLFINYSNGRVSEKWLEAWPMVKTGEKALTSDFFGQKGLWNYITNEN